MIATIEGFTRADVDAYAAESQARADQAWEACRFDRSDVPVVDRNGVTVLDRDQHFRPGTTVEELGELKPAFEGIGLKQGFDAVALQRYHWIERINHVHTGGNSSGIVDGAALVLLGNERAGTEQELTPRAHRRHRGHRV